MTSNSVKNLSSLVNFVGGTSNAANLTSKANSISFGSMMDKAQGEQTKTDIGSTLTKDSSKDLTSKTSDVSKASDDRTKKTDNVEETPKKEMTEDDNKTEDVTSTEESTKTEDKTKAEETKKAVEEEETDIPATDFINTEPVLIPEVLEENMEVLASAVVNLVDTVAAVLEVEPKEILDAVDALGMEKVDILDTKNMEKIVLEIDGENDPMALVTNGELLENVKELTKVVDATIEDLAADMDIEVSELKDMIASVKETALNEKPEMEMSVEANSDQDTIQKPIRVFTAKAELSEGDEITLKTDENGNEIKTVTVEKADTANTDNTDANTKSDENDTPEKENGRETKTVENHQTEHVTVKTATFENPINQIIENTAPETPNTMFSEESRRIMDQIMDHMKVNITNETNELELQLHPASLGSVKINLSAKAGEVTAEFKVSNEQVKEAVEAQLNDLKEAFRAQGTKVTAIEVSVETNAFDQNLYQGKEPDQNSGGEGQKKRTRRINLDNLDALFEDENADEEDILAAQILQATGGTVDYTA